MENRGCFAPLAIGVVAVAALASPMTDDGWTMWLPALLALATVFWIRTVLDR
jgi:hypothetical protein